MNHRNLSILIGTLCLGIAVGMAVFTQDSLATSSLDDLEYLQPPPAAPIASGETLDPAPAEGAFRPSAGPVAVAGQNRQEDTSGWTSGTIRGDVQLAVSILDKLGSMTLIVEEIRVGADVTPHRIMQPVERGRGTPTFEVTGVPFSEFPYRVTLHAAGLNCSARTLTVDEDQPLHEDVVLTITPGAPFSVLLRDQDGGPHPEVDLVLRPVGLPHGRPRLSGKTDNFGSAVFESVLAGQYELTATLLGQPFGGAEVVTVQPGSRQFGRKIQGQGHVMTVPRGVQLEVEIGDGFYGLANAEVSMVRTDRRRLKELTATTDAIGRARFPHLQPGQWQLTVELEQFRRVDRMITLKPDMEPQFQRIKLVRGR